MDARTASERPLTERPVIIGNEAYVCPDYARAEGELLWSKVWQVACRAEEIEKIGDYVTYDVANESITVIRVAEDRIAAYYNVCPHRGRKLTEGCGHTKQLVCKFHAWKWDLDGNNVEVVRAEGYGSSLSPEDVRLKPIKVDSWGGWVFINMDPDCVPLREYLEPAASMLDPFQLENMRYRWRQWIKYPCNWKVAIEAFNEGYHVYGTHPQIARYSPKPTWSGARGIHSCFGAAQGEGTGGASSGAAGAADMRVGLATSLNQMWEEVNATTTETMVKVANLLVEELPEGTPAMEVQMHLMKRTIEEDAKRGVIWPQIDPAHFAASGNDWHIFPNTVVIHGPTFALCYRARPDGVDPDSCIFEVYTLEKYPEGQEPRPDNVNAQQPTEEYWRKVLSQDFSNMAQVQQGMKSKGFAGARPHPVEEIPIINFHRVLAEYMGRGMPQPLD